MKKNKQKGMTLLEYCAGAAVILGVVFVAFQTLGDSMQTFFDGVSSWMTSNAPGGGTGGN